VSFKLCDAQKEEEPVAITFYRADNGSCAIFEDFGGINQAYEFSSKTINFPAFEVRNIPGSAKHGPNPGQFTIEILRTFKTRRKNGFCPNALYRQAKQWNAFLNASSNNPSQIGLLTICI